MIFVISVVVTILIPDKNRTLHCLSSMAGDGAQDVAARMTSTLFLK